MRCGIRKQAGVEVIDATMRYNPESVALGTADCAEVPGRRHFMARFRLRFSMLSLMQTVFISAVGFAALRNASELWAGLTSTLALGLCSLAIVGSILSRGDSRSFCTGYAVFAWVQWEG